MVTLLHVFRWRHFRKLNVTVKLPTSRPTIASQLLLWNVFPFPATSWWNYSLRPVGVAVFVKQSCDETGNIIKIGNWKSAKKLYTLILCIFVFFFGIRVGYIENYTFFLLVIFILLPRFFRSRRPVNCFRSQVVSIWTTVYCLMIWSLAHLSRHPSSSPVDYELYAHSCEDNSLRCSNSIFPAWGLLLSPWVQSLLVSGDYSCTLWYTVNTPCCAYALQE